MLRIKEGIDLKELEKFGFYFEGNTYKYDLPLHKCAYVCIIQSEKELVFPCYNLKRYQFIFKNKIIKKITKIQNDLIEAGLVEKVEE